jgi:C4-dicarboxylate-specific signal transduction histidine kinase
LVQADKMASLGLLVSGIAHEINNPNNYISLSAPLLRKAWESLSPCIQECRQRLGDMVIGTIPLPEFMENIGKLMDGIEEGSRKIKRIVASLKDYARQDSLEMRAVDINTVAKSAVNLTMPLIKKRTKNFSISCTPSPLIIKGNLQRLEQVVINLVQNACESLASEVQSIQVRCEEQGGKAALLVTDTGCGIQPENMNKIVDPFFTTKRESGGTGLGLSVSLGIVKEHGGEMLFQSEMGKGTTVTLLFNSMEPNG